MSVDILEIGKSSAKELKYLMSRLARDGHVIERRGSGHFMVKHKDGKGMVTLSATPGKRHASNVATRELRRQGFDV